MDVLTRYMLFGLISKVLESTITTDDLFNSKYHAVSIICLSVVHFILVKIGKRGVIIFITTILSPLFPIFTKIKWSTDKNMIEATWNLELNSLSVVIGLSKTFKMSPNNIYLLKTTMITQPIFYWWLVQSPSREIILWCTITFRHNNWYTQSFL